MGNNQETITPATDARHFTPACGSHTAILGQIAMMVAQYAPDGVCETEETVRHLCRIADGARLAKSELERIRADKLAQAGMGDEATALSAARHALNSANVKITHGPESSDNLKP